jgi:hypothetical protein
MATQEPIFLYLTQDFKGAVAMGMVTAIALFWSSKPNPAIIVRASGTVALLRQFPQRQGQWLVMGALS